MRYPNSFARTHVVSRLLRQHGETSATELEQQQTVVAVGGRLMHRAAHEEGSCGTVQDQSGRIDVLVSDAATGRANRQAFESWSAGDIIGVAGMLCRTRAGALAVRAHEVERLAPALRPLPAQEDATGYLGVLLDPRKRALFELRGRLIAGIRAYLGGTTYVEVETPLLQEETAPGAVTFQTHHHALDRSLHLRTSADLYLKRLLVGGIEKLYELNRSFRNGPPTAQALREGTVLELYCAYSSYLYMMALLEQLIASAARYALGSQAPLRLEPPFQRIAATAAPKALPVQPTYLVDSPAAQAPHARRKDAAPQLAEHFELYIAGHKVAEGRSEVNDADEVAARYGPAFAHAVEYGLPPASGLTLWIDPLVMVLSGSASLHDTLIFDHHADR